MILPEEMVSYASRTGTGRQIEAMAARDWGWLIGPEDMGGEIRGGMRHAIDNGAWPAHISGKPWDAALFRRCYRQHGRGADFIVAPDIVMGGQASLERTREWLPILRAAPELAGAAILIAVQDGMSEAEITPLMDDRTGIFLGGGTEWKLAMIRKWGEFSAQRQCWYHVGRVNSVVRINLCAWAGATSFDGTAGTRFAVNIPRLDNARRQPDLFPPSRRSRAGL
jgi:hypothetical protein